jgi:general secretion pathway protein F
VAVWTYRALTAGGRAEAGVVDAETARAAWQVLRARGVYPTELAEDAESPGRARRVRAAELAACTRELATLLVAGVPLADALAAAAEHVEHPTLERALTTARARLREGASLADALGTSPRVFPPLFRDLVRAGEESGALAAVLQRLASHTEAEAATRARVRAALAYPAVMTLATTAVLAFVLAWVVPQTTALFAATGKPLPLATRVLAATGSVIARFWWLGLAAASAAGFALRRWLASDGARRRVDVALLRVPGVRRLVRATAAGRLARTLATLLAGGVPLEAALGIAGPITGNRVLADAVATARARVREGGTLAPALRASGAFPPVLVQLVAVGERSGGLADALAHAADTYEAEVGRTVAAATALVEPALILAMGGVVLVLVTAVLLPLFELGALAG